MVVGEKTRFWIPPGLNDAPGPTPVTVVFDVQLLGIQLALEGAPGQIQSILDQNAHIQKIAAKYAEAEDFFFLGRQYNFPVALEGALKLKEISYAHAEGDPAGELKHGPNALVDDKLPVVVIATCDHRDPDSVLRYHRTLEVMKEVRSRKGPLVTVATEGDKEVSAIAEHVFYVPPAPELLLPIVEVIPLQLFAYHIAVNKGYDVDHPRNLVKAVITE